MMFETLHPVQAFVPIDTTGAGQDGDWVHFHNYRQCMIILSQGAWAAGTSAVTVEQAKDNSDSGSVAKALPIEFMYRGTALTDDTYAKTAITSNTFLLPNTANTITFLVVKAGDLDQMNGFTHIRVRTATPGASADLLSGLYIFGDPAIAAPAENLASAIT